MIRPGHCGSVFSSGFPTMRTSHLSGTSLAGSQKEISRFGLFFLQVRDLKSDGGDNPSSSTSARRIAVGFMEELQPFGPRSFPILRCLSYDHDLRNGRAQK